MQYEIIEDVLISYNFISGAFVKLESLTPDFEYTVIFDDADTGETYYIATINGNSWCKCSVQYFVNWNITILKDSKSFWQYRLNLENKNVVIEIDSGSLGDNLGWFPYMEEFRKKHNCIVYAGNYGAAYSDNFFKKEYYPNLYITDSGAVQETAAIFAKYKIGVYYNKTNTGFNPDHHRDTFLGVPHQQIATDILGLPFKEIRPLIDERPRPKSKKQVCISMFSTAQAKFWNNRTGWQEVVDWLNKQGYEVKLLGKEQDGFMGNYIPNGVIPVESTKDIEVAIEELRNSAAFIGIGSGLSWLAWALNTPMILISGFSNPITEMQSNCKRIKAPRNSCTGCYNRHIFDRGDWLWCPDHKNTDRHFECSRKITSRMVIVRLQELLK
jgi:autotransporter strand-loop-strand O-heptosyltransferase